MVVNGACKDADFKHMIDIKNSAKFNKKDINIQFIDDNSLIAVQGPKAA